MKNAIDKMMLEEFIVAAIKEDVGNGDLTSLAVVPPDKYATGRLVAKASGVFCGEDALRCIYGDVFANTEIELLVHDGDRVQAGDLLAKISGNAMNLLIGERTAINVVQHLSGVATATASLAEKLAGTGARITDTRKTTPGMRFLEKYAVRVGGGTNHRFDLSDGILIKDNHIVAAGGITEAVKKAKSWAPHLLKVEVEVENVKDMLEAIEAGADVIMLDNMSIDDMKEAVKAAAGRVQIEASGNMDEKDIREVALCGVDVISVGAITHSAKALDISLKFTL